MERDSEAVPTPAGKTQLLNHSVVTQPLARMNAIARLWTELSQGDLASGESLGGGGGQACLLLGAAGDGLRGRNNPASQAQTAK